MSIAVIGGWYEEGALQSMKKMACKTFCSLLHSRHSFKVKKAAPGAGAAYNTVSGFLRWAPELQECSHQLIESRINRIHADPDPNTVARVFIHPAVVGFAVVSPVHVPGNNAFLVMPIGFQVASLFKSGVML